MPTLELVLERSRPSLDKLLFEYSLSLLIASTALRSWDNRANLWPVPRHCLAHALNLYQGVTECQKTLEFVEMNTTNTENERPESPKLPPDKERFAPGAGKPNPGKSGSGIGKSGAVQDADRSVPRDDSVKSYSLKLAAAAAQVACDNKGADVMVLDVCDQTALFDYFVLATGTSRRQLHAISEEIDDKLQKELGDKRLNIEGYEESRWIVLDYGSIVIHLFDEETRSYYDLESLWGDARSIPLSELGIQV